MYKLHVILCLVLISHRSASQFDDVILNFRFNPTNDTTNNYYTVVPITINGYSLYDYFLKDTTWITQESWFNRIKIKTADLKIDQKNNCWLDSGYNAIKGQIPNGSYYLVNHKGLVQICLDFEFGFLSKIYFFNKSGKRINEIAEFTNLLNKRCTYFKFYSRNWKNKWELSLITIDEEGVLHMHESVERTN